MKKVAIVTGGSKGIGKQIVLTLLESQWEVFYLSRTKGDYDSSLEDLHHVACDMSDTESLEESINSVVAQRSKIHLLVNNAGITRDGLIMRMSNEAWDDVLHLNLTTSFITSRALSRLMAKQREGVIINISSVVGITGNGGQTNYSASKAGLIGFSKSLAKELASRNVRVNVVAPGFIATDMTDVLPEEMKKQLEDLIPLKRIGEAKEIANVVDFLASDKASYITGQVLIVDGGLAM
ncbi:MAG: 3-oxoacyl-[acyl-carrier-protein] reductase [Sphaerochaetaceae bacterium]